MSKNEVSVLARLKNKAQQIGRSYQLCLQLFCQEEFLRRLEKSSYVDNFILKGGLFIYSLTEFESRVTVDVDFLLKNVSNTIEKLKEIIQEIILIETENTFITFEVKKIEQISVLKKYPGISVKIISRIANTETPFSIDFGVGDIIVPNQIKLSIPTQLEDFKSPIVNSYSLESTIAEKLDAILFLMDFSSRMKDYYDIYFLLHNFDFDGNSLCKALDSTFNNRNHTFSVEQFLQMLSFKDDKNMNAKWNAFVKKIEIYENDFSIIIKKIESFLFEPFCAVMNNQSFNKNWECKNLQWN